MKREKISELTTNRLSVYLRCLNELAAAGIKTVSSQELAEQFNLNSAQIRKDLGYFGEFGVRGIGYFIDDLQRHLTIILGLDRPHHVGIVGAGRLGTALANYNGLTRSRRPASAESDHDRRRESRFELCPRALDRAQRSEGEDSGSHNVAGIVVLFSGTASE